MAAGLYHGTEDTAWFSSVMIVMLHTRHTSICLGAVLLFFVPEVMYLSSGGHLQGMQMQCLGYPEAVCLVLLSFDNCLLTDSYMSVLSALNLRKSKQEKKMRLAVNVELWITTSSTFLAIHLYCCGFNSCVWGEFCQNTELKRHYEQFLCTRVWQRILSFELSVLLLCVL